MVQVDRDVDNHAEAIEPGIHRRVDPSPADERVVVGAAQEDFVPYTSIGGIVALVENDLPEDRSVRAVVEVVPGTDEDVAEELPIVQ